MWYLKTIKPSWIFDYYVLEKEMKRSKKVKEHGIEAGATGSASVSHYKHESMFGNSFENAVRYFASNDGVKVPLPIRICIDIIEQKG